MRLKPKRRLLLLVAAVAVLAVGAFSYFVVRGWQRTRLADQFLTEALAAHQAHDYNLAMEKAGAYLKRDRLGHARPNDPRRPDVVLAYAEGRRNVQEHDGHNYRDSLSFYNEYLLLRPDDRATKMTLLQTYNICGFGAEACELAATLRPPLDQCTAADLPVLREEATACLPAKAYDHLDKVADRIIALAPTDLVAHRCRIKAMANRTERAAARDYADALLKAHPDDQSALLVAAVSRQIAPTNEDAAAALAWTSQAAGLDPKTGARVKPVTYPDLIHVVQIVELFDRLRQFDRSLAVLRDAADTIEEVNLQRSLVRRLWQNSEMDEIIQRTAGLDPGAHESDPDLLAFRALALIGKGRAAEAAPLEAALHNRAGDYRLTSWSKAILLLDTARAPKPADAVQAWREILKLSPNEPIYRAALADALASLGRTEEARDEWDRAAKHPIAASWPLPFYRAAQTLLVEGRSEEAARAAHQAYIVAGSRAAIVILWFETQAAAIQKGGRAVFPATDVLAELERALEASATIQGPPQAVAAYRERLLVPHVILLAHTGQRDKARDLALASLDAQPPLQPETIQRLAATSRIENLGIDQEVLKRLATADTADAKLIQAAELAEAGKLDEAVALVRALASARPEDPSAITALPRLYERLARPEAKGAWVALGDAHPDDLAVQRACLQSSSAATDPEFINRTIERYTRLTGAESELDPVVVCARARALLGGGGGAPSRADRDRAVAMLSAFVAKHPNVTEPKLLLASALVYTRPGEIRPDVGGAIAHLTKAAALEPRSAPIALQLARLLQWQGEFASARDHLSRIAADPSAERQARRTAAEMLIAQGDAAGVAIDTLSALAAQLGDHTPPRLLVTLADAYLAARQPAAAKAIYDRLAAGAASDPDSIYATARYFSKSGDQVTASAALGRLDAIKLDPGIKEAIHARLAWDRGDATSAAQNFEACVTAAPKRPDFWLQYAGLLLQSLRFDQAADVARRGLAANPQDPQLASMLGQAEALAKGGPDAERQALIAALATNPAAADAAEALKALPAGAPATDALIQIANRFPNLALVQAYVVRRVAPYNFPSALTLVQRAMQTSPTDPAPARAAAEICLAAGRFRDMLAAAQEWRNRDRSGSPEADIAIAEAHVGLEQPQPGLKALAPYVATAVARPEDSFSAAILNIHARLLIQDKREPEARALLEPLLASPTIRLGVWLGIARDTMPVLDTALAWLDRFSKAIPANQPGERIALAKAYYVLADRFTDQQTSLFQRALALLDDLSRDPATGTAETFQALAIIRHRTGDLPGAEEAYRRAVELNPKDGLSLNNLANIALELRADLPAALDLATRAVAAASSPDNLDTLGDAHLAIGKDLARKGDRARARDQFRLAAQNYRKAAALTPSVIPLMSAADADERAGEPKDLLLATQTYENVLARAELPPDGIAAVKNNLAMDLVRLNRGEEDLQRARTLISDAVRAKPHYAFFDTKGWIDLAHGDAAEAQAAFRQAIELYRKDNQAALDKLDESKGLPSAVIGLATVLASGTAEERAEAARRLEAIDAPALESDEDRTRLDKARQRLATPAR